MSDLLNEASLVLIPSGIKASKVYAQIPEDGSGDMTFARASTGTRINSQGFVEVVPYNLLFCSEQLGNTFAWQLLNGITVNSNTTTAPNGTTTADTLIDDGSGASVVRQFDYSVQAGQTYTFSVWLKKASGNPVTRLRIEQDASPFNNTSVDVTPTNEWVRYSVTRTIEAGITSVNYAIFADINAGDSVYAWGAQVNQGATVKNYIEVGTSKDNYPRLNYQNGGGGCPSLLLEAQRTNYARNNNNLLNWGIIYTTVNTNSAVSPDGYVNAINLVPDTSNSNKMVYDTLTNVSAGGNFTMSCYAKANGYSKFALRESYSVGYYASFNLSNGTVIDNGGNTASIENVGNGWYRCIVSVAFSGNVNIGLIPLNDSYTSGQPFSYSYSGDGTKGVLVYGAQLEVSASYASSLIPTTNATSVTRVADYAYKTSASGLIGQTEGVVFVDFNLPSIEESVDYPFIIDLYNDNNNRFGFARYPNGGVHIYMISGGSSQFTYNTTQLTGDFKLALGYKNNDCVVYLNGSLLHTVTSASIPTTNVIALNAINSFGGYNTQQLIKQVVLFPTRLTNAQLADLTS